jgi:hypothetical protein
MQWHAHPARLDLVLSREEAARMCHALTQARPFGECELEAGGVRVRIVVVRESGEAPSG